MPPSEGHRPENAGSDPLPRLAFVTEVPPLNLSSGPAQLYRLLIQYPADRLLLFEDAGLPRYPGYELPGVIRRRMMFNWTRLMRSRFGPWNGALMFMLDPLLLARRLSRIFRASGCEAVLGIAHGHVWWAAFVASRRLGLPFHLIMHDHWRYSMALPGWLDRRAERRFATAYRGAASRLVISPGMARRYESAYGAGARLLYPLRPRESEVHLRAPDRADRSFCFAYAGGMDGEWARRAVVDLAHAVDPLGARVLVCQNVSLDALRASGLTADNVDLQPFLPALDLHRHLRLRADALFLPMSFGAADRDNMEVCFPSKLADYTVPALPLLVYAPPYSSAVEWAAANPGTAVVVDRRDPGLLRSAAGELLGNPELRARLGAAAAAAGLRDFSATGCFERFSSALRVGQTAL
jgi:glycosyltransferase involved in cell wall biosynthesis